jgi:hypothetical protein
MNTIAGVVLALLLTVTPAHHYIDRVVPGDTNDPVTYLKDVRWNVNAIPNHVIVSEDVMDLAYSILETKAVRPCQGDCPEVAYKGGEIFFFTFEPGMSGTMYRTSDVPNMYKVHGYEWSWYNFEVKYND